jgi:hypothetical protein
MTNMVMYHATTAEAAESIKRSRRFLLGNQGYAGAGIYFASRRPDARKHAKCGAATVMIKCKVNLGRCTKAEKYEVDKSFCDAYGYDSVHIDGTSTYAVYDSSRIVIQEFTHAASGEPWLALTLTPTEALNTIIAAIEKSPSKSLDASTDMGSLYAKHPGLREALGSSSLKAFCESNTELKWNEGCISSTVPSLTSRHVLAILIEAIRASPSKVLNAATDMTCLYSRHRGLREALPSSNLEAFCKSHAELAWNRGRVMLALTSENALKILIAEIQASPSKSLNMSHIGMYDSASLYSKHEGLQEFIASTGLKAFCESHTELIWKMGNVSLTQAKPTERPTEKGPRNRPTPQQEGARSQMHQQYQRENQQRKLLAQLQHEEEYAKQRSCFLHERDTMKLSLLRSTPAQSADASRRFLHGQGTQRTVTPPASTGPASPLEVVARFVIDGVWAGMGCLSHGYLHGCAALSCL